MGKDVKQATGLLIKRTRIKRNITQEVLAIRAGTYKQHISDIERGIENPQISTLYAIAVVLEVSVAYLTDFRKEIARARLLHQTNRPDLDIVKKMIGERITDFRKQKGLSFYEVMQIARMPKYYPMPKIENGTIDFTLMTLFYIAKGLGISMAKVLDIHDEIKEKDKLLTVPDRQSII